jgi:hypothetical protein
MRIEGYGLSLEVPSGWEGQILGASQDIPPGAISTPAVHAGNFALFPPQNTCAYGTPEVKTMAAGDIFLALLEMNPAWAGVGLYSEKGFPQLQPSDFSPAALEVGIAGRVGVQRFVYETGRTFVVYAVAAATQAPSASDLKALNSLLASLSVSPSNQDYYYHSPTPA